MPHFANVGTGVRGSRRPKRDGTLTRADSEGGGVQKKQWTEEEIASFLDEAFNPTWPAWRKRWEFYRRQCFLLFEVPDSSKLAMVVSLVIMGLIGISVTAFMLETVPEIQEETDPQVFFIVEAITTAFFTLEFIGRLVPLGVTPEHTTRLFWGSMLNWFDLLAILPFYIELGVSGFNLVGLRVLRVVRLIRVFRVFKLSRYSVGLRVMGEGLKQSLHALWILVFLMLIGVILFSSALYFAENSGGTPSPYFTSIPATFWWAVVTMTTVGYGDVVPQTPLGRLVASFAMLSGILCIALPVAIVGNKFQNVYKEMESEENMKKTVSRKGTFRTLQSFNSLRAHNFQSETEGDDVGKPGDVGGQEEVGMSFAKGRNRAASISISPSNRQTRGSIVVDASPKRASSPDMRTTIGFGQPTQSITVLERDVPVPPSVEPQNNLAEEGGREETGKREEDEERGHEVPTDPPPNARRPSSARRVSIKETAGHTETISPPAAVTLSPKGSPRSWFARSRDRDKGGGGRFSGTRPSHFSSSSGVEGAGVGIGVGGEMIRPPSAMSKPTLAKPSIRTPQDPPEEGDLRGGSPTGRSPTAAQGKRGGSEVRKELAHLAAELLDLRRVQTEVSQLLARSRSSDQDMSSQLTLLLKQLVEVDSGDKQKEKKPPGEGEKEKERDSGRSGDG